MDIKLIININTDNSAFDGLFEKQWQLRQILESIKERVIEYNYHRTEGNESNPKTSESISDCNGNNVGEWSYEEISDE